MTSKNNTKSSKKRRLKRANSARSNGGGGKKPVETRYTQKTVSHEEASKDGLWIYGRHTVAAALANPDRKIHQLLSSRQSAQWLVDRNLEEPMVRAKAMEVKPADLDEFLPSGAVHQGLAARVEPLPSPALETFLDEEHTHSLIVVLDQISDPQNIGTIFRNSAAFGASAIIAQERKLPSLSGALAKAAVGTIEKVPCICVVNIARTLNELKEAGFMCIGLAGDGSVSLGKMPLTDKIALVLGAEGAGLRPLVAKSCDRIVHIPISQHTESLNVSTAAAIALYEISNRKE